MAKVSVTVRLGVDEDRLARACAGVAGISKPEWIARAIRRLAETDYPDLVARMARDRGGRGQGQQPPRGGRREE